MSQFRNKAEAQQAIQDMETRARRENGRIVDAICAGDKDAADRHRDIERNYLNEAARIRALLHTLPD